LETLERDIKDKPAPKTEDKKTDEFNVAFKAEDQLAIDIEKKESSDLIDEGKIIRGNTTEDLVFPHPLSDRKRSINHQGIRRIFACCNRRKTIKQVKTSSPSGGDTHQQFNDRPKI
jgi:hypothetical protein